MRRSPAPRGPNSVRTLLRPRWRLITVASSLMRRLMLLWLTLSWSRSCGGTRRSTCGSRGLPTGLGGTCCRIQRYIGMIRGDVFLGIHMGCGCIFLVVGRRAWYWRAVFLVYPLAQKQRKQPLAFRLFHARRCARQVLGCFQLSSGPSLCVSLRWFWKEFPLFLARAVHTWEHGTLFPPCFVSGSFTSCV